MTADLDSMLDRAVRTTERIEQKFYIAPRQVGFAHGLLRHLCRPDDEHPTDLVNSLYFDTIDLDVHQASQSGDFGKDKVRIRWYGEDGGPDGERTVYLELKSKQGFAGTKWRREMAVSARCLGMPQLARGIVPRATLHDTLYSFGYFPSEMLFPVVKITYRRHRFVEPATGERLALDCQIRSTMVIPRPGNGEKELELAGAILEIKGTSVELPVLLRRVGMLDVDWSRFSKYSACVEAHEERLGSVGRVSPSGRVIR